MSLEFMEKVLTEYINLGVKWHMNAIKSNENWWAHQGNDH